MSTRLTIFFAAVLSLLVLLLAGNLFLRPAPRASTRAEADPAYRHVLAMLDDKCQQCHSSRAALPYYGGLPGVERLIAADRARACRAFDLDAELPPSSAGPVPAATLAKLETAALGERMPPLRYRALHLNAMLDRAEAASLVAWAEDERHRRPARLY